MKFKKYLPLLLAVLIPLTAMAVKPRFSYADIENENFVVHYTLGLRSTADGQYYTSIEGKKIVKRSYETNETVSNYNLGMKINDYQFSSDEKTILLEIYQSKIYRHSYYSDFYLYDIDSGSCTKINESKRCREAQLSPVGNRLAYVDSDCIRVVEYKLNGKKFDFDFRSPFGKTQQDLRYGIPDWVYEEEFGFKRAYEWSPDGSKVMFMKFDESEVKEFQLTRYPKLGYPEMLRYKYPRVGEKNSIVSVFLWNIEHDNSTESKDSLIEITGLGDYEYIPRIGWTPSGNPYLFTLNRHQNDFRVLVVEQIEGAVNCREVYRETDKRYVELVKNNTVTFLPDGDKFMVLSEARGSGYMHLHLYSCKKGFLHSVTSGKWEVTELLDVVGDRVYYISTEISPLQRTLYSVKLNGKRKKQITPLHGTYAILPSEGFKYFISRHSSLNTTPVETLHTGDGELLRTLNGNEQLEAFVKKVGFPNKEFFTVPIKNHNGNEELLNGYIVYPVNFDQTQQYPVIMTQYSGPGSQQVVDRWTVNWTDMMTEYGYIVVCVDGRGTGVRGEDFRKCTYANLGYYEVLDQLAVRDYLAAKLYVDKNRIGIYGWSYGGFMALNCALQGNGLFKMAIAVAPVTSWRLYDTIYTEMYNGLLGEKPEEYDNNSPITHASKLDNKTKLLIIHGTGDENVHVQNTYAMARELTKAGKEFDMMLYTDDDHGMHPTGRHHVMKKMISYTLDNL